MSPYLVPLSAFAMVVLIVALSHVSRIRSLEVDVHQKMCAREMEHQQKMRELDLEIQRVKAGA